MHVLQKAIAGLVFQTMKARECSLNEARAVIARDLGISLDTVRRAWRQCRRSAGTTAMLLEWLLYDDPERYRDGMNHLQERLREIRRSRGR